MLKNLFLISILIALNAKGQIAPIHTSKLPNGLKESSGLAIFQNLYYTHNDGGDASQFYALDSLGNLVETYTITNASNMDWEAMQIYKQGDMLIGDIGNNGNSRSDLRFYLLRGFHQQGSTQLTADTISFNYARQNTFPPSGADLHFDAEAFIVVKDSIFIFSKNRSNPYNQYCYVSYVPLQKGEHSALLIDSIFTGAGPKEFNWITDANLQNNTLWLLSHGYVLRFDSFKEHRFGIESKYQLSSFSQKEACAYQPPYLWVTDEYTSVFGGSNLYQYLIDSLEPMSTIQINPISDLNLMVFDEFFSIHLPAKSELSFYNLEGKLIDQFEVNGGYSEISFSKFNTSTFILKTEVNQLHYSYRFFKP